MITSVKEYTIARARHPVRELSREEWIILEENRQEDDERKLHGEFEEFLKGELSKDEFARYLKSGLVDNGLADKVKELQRRFYEKMRARL